MIIRRNNPHLSYNKYYPTFHHSKTILCSAPDCQFNSADWIFNPTDWIFNSADWIFNPAD